MADPTLLRGHILVLLPPAAQDPSSPIAWVQSWHLFLFHHSVTRRICTLFATLSQRFSILPSTLIQPTNDHSSSFPSSSSSCLIDVVWRNTRIFEQIQPVDLTRNVFYAVLRQCLTGPSAKSRVHRPKRFINERQGTNIASPISTKMTKSVDMRKEERQLMALNKNMGVSVEYGWWQTMTGSPTLMPMETRWQSLWTDVVCYGWLSEWFSPSFSFSSGAC